MIEEDEYDEYAFKRDKDGYLVDKHGKGHAGNHGLRQR